MNKEDFIQDYIANRLSTENEARAKAMIETDAEARELYETHQEMADAFRLVKDKTLKKRLQDLETNELSIGEKPTSQKSLVTGFLRIAVAAVCILGVFLLIDQFTQNEDLFEMYFEENPNTYLPVTRSETTKSVPFEAFKAYENGQYATAETIFETMLQTENNLNIRFYYAMSLLNQEKYELALNELHSLTKTTFDYQAESLWYAALIELKLTNFQTAEKQLQQLQTLFPLYKSDDVSTLLKKIATKKKGK